MNGKGKMKDDSFVGFAHVSRMIPRWGFEGKGYGEKSKLIWSGACQWTEEGPPVIDQLRGVFTKYAYLLGLLDASCIGQLKPPNQGNFLI